MWQFSLFVSLLVCIGLTLVDGQEANLHVSVGKSSAHESQSHLAARQPVDPPASLSLDRSWDVPSPTLDFTSLTYYGRSEPDHVQTYSDTIYYTTTETATILVPELAVEFGGVTPLPTTTAWDTQVATTTDYRPEVLYKSTSTVIRMATVTTPILITTHKVVSTQTTVAPETSLVPISRPLSEINTPPNDHDDLGRSRSRHNINNPGGGFDDWYSVKIRDNGFFLATNTGYPVSVIAISTAPLTISVTSAVPAGSTFTSTGPQGITTLQYRGLVRTTTTRYPNVLILGTVFETSTITETRYVPVLVTRTDYNIHTLVAGSTPLYYEACNNNRLTQIDDDRVVTAIAWRQDYQRRSADLAYDCCVECIDREDCAANFWVKPSQMCYLLPHLADQMCNADNLVAEYDVGELDDYDFFRFTLGNGYCGEFNGEPPVGCSHGAC